MHNYVKYGLKKSVYVAKSESHLNKVVFSLNRSKVPYSHYIQKVSTIHTFFICILLKKKKLFLICRNFKKNIYTWFSNCSQILKQSTKKISGRNNFFGKVKEKEKIPEMTKTNEDNDSWTFTLFTMSAQHYHKNTFITKQKKSYNLITLKKTACVNLFRSI